MAKESMKAREVKRAKLVAKYAEKRAALKQIVRTGDPAEAFEAAQKLQDLPKNSNPIRMHNRCKLTGRPKGYIRQFGISRIQFREMASNGLIPGVKVEIPKPSITNCPSTFLIFWMVYTFGYYYRIR